MAGRLGAVPPGSTGLRRLVRRLTNDKANGPLVGWREYVKVDHAALRLNGTQKPDTVLPWFWRGS